MMHGQTKIKVKDKFKLDGLDHRLLLVLLSSLHVTRCIWNKYKALSLLPVISLDFVFALYNSDVFISV